jgi:hypothetical protein
VAELVASKYDEGTVYMAQNGKRDDDFEPYLWKSTDYGEHWTSIVNNLPSGPVNVIKEDPRNPNVLYVGTDLGVYVSLNGGEEWEALSGGGPPSSYFQDLVIHPEDDILVAATHGRGLWALDVRPIQALTPEVMERPLYLFETENARAPRGFREPGITANIQYWVGSATGEATVTILDRDGNVVKELTGNGERGVNSVVWDLTVGDTDPSGPGGRGRMGRAAPGLYSVVVVAGSNSVSGTLLVMD